MIGVVVGDTLDGEAEMNLLEIGAALDPGTTDIARRLGDLAGVGGQAAEQALRQIDEMGMLKPAGAGNCRPGLSRDPGRSMTRRSGPARVA